MTHVPALPVRRGLIFVSAAGIAWGTGGAVGDFLRRAGDLSPVAVTFWRFLIGAALLLAVTFLGRPASARRANPLRSWRMILALGATMAISQVSYFAAIAESGVALATMITMGANPLFVAAGGRLLLGERLSRAAKAGVGAAVAGLAMLAGGPGEFSPAGVGYAVLSAAAYAAMTLLSGPARPGRPDQPDQPEQPDQLDQGVQEGQADRRDQLGRRDRPGQGTPGDSVAWSFAAGAVCLLPLAMARGVLPSGGDTGAAVLSLAYLGVVPTALAYGLFFAGLGAVSGTTAAVVALVEPLVAALIGVLLLGEHLTALQLAGGVLLMAAVYRLARAELTTGPAGAVDGEK
ncbi:EamA family transporter [Microtetraspora sp. NBRC 16547]|uniref:DMT family transporter n=1 Tax=Microtetraspora sp. NBRC 16547 TaxID=3030993 RepID=UPI0024A0176D|nr:EamA family transporter [Microtetraspora sp. NBRC 16547]GLX00731.1 membrane protein [Microtetraspora sp. NBRC 16547]